MLPVTAAFDTAISENARRMAARVTINFTDLFNDPTASGTSANENRITQTEQVSDGKTNPSFKWLSCDGKSIADGSFHPAPSTAALANSNEVGWWSNELSGSGGSFSSDQIVIATFASRKVTSFSVIGDNKLIEYPVDFDVLFYAGAVLTHTENITGNTEIVYNDIITEISAITSMEVHISKWSEEDRCAKILEASTAVIKSFDDVDISNFQITEQREISNDNSIPTGNIAAADLSISFMNADRIFDANNTASPIYGVVKPNNKVDVEIGVFTADGLEYVPVFSGWTKGWDVPDASVEASVECMDILDFLTQTKITTSKVTGGETFSDWFETVLQDAGLDNTFYNIDSTLDGTDYIVPYGWFADISHRDALELLATACSAAVWQDRAGLIQVQAVDWFDNNNLTSEQTFTRAEYMDKSNQPIYENIANSVIVTTSPVVISDTVTVYDTLPSAPETVSASSTEDFTIYYTDFPVSDQTPTIDPPVAGLSITTKLRYAWGAIFTVVNTNGTDKDFLFHVTGKTYTVQGKQTVIKSDQTSIDLNGLQEFRYEDNYFLQVKNLADDIATSLLASFKDPERDLTANFSPGGNPALEQADRITITDRYQSKEYNIVTSTINYDGGMSQQIQGRVT